MPGPYIPNPVPWWMRPENASVLDSLPKKVARKIATLAGLTDPQNQILAMMTPMIPEGQATVSAPLKAIGGKLSELAEKVGIKAYHGSPHDFDKFSTAKIGTGEGAQAYGHGLYFAENEGVANDYRKKLSRFGHASEMPEDMATSILLDGKVVNGSTPSNKLTPLERAALSRHYSGGQAQAIRDLEDSLKYMTPGTEAYEGDKATLDALKSTDLTGRVQPFKGRMYEVQIHASPDQFLDWDKPLSEQPEKIRQAIDAIGAKRTIPGPVEIRQNVYGDKKFYHVNRASGEWGSQAFDTKEAAQAAAPADAIVQDVATSTSKGGEFYSRAGHLLGGPDVLSDKLKQAGIPGIRYLDAGSRAGGEGTRNFVIFDDSLVSILKKYGIALPVIEGLRERAKQNGGVISRQDVDALQ